MKCYSRGNINASILILGECPGKEEANHKIISDGKDYLMPIPFCGKAGRLLHEILIGWGPLEEGDFIMSNMIKDMLLDGKRVRTGTEEELIAEHENVLKEISKIDPKLIITLGKGPVWALCYKDKLPLYELRIGKVQGIIHTINVNDKDYKVLPLYHPSAIVRDNDTGGEREYGKMTAESLKNNRDLLEKILGRVLLF